MQVSQASQFGDAQFGDAQFGDGAVIVALRTSGILPLQFQETLSCFLFVAQSVKYRLISV